MIDRPSRRPIHRLALAAVVLAVACGDDGGEATSSPVTATTTMTTSSPTSGATSDDSGGDTTTTSPGTSTSTESEGGSVDATADVTTGGGAVACDPQMAPFLMPEGTLTAAIVFDFAAGTCRATSTPVMSPQIVFEVRPTGLVDALLHGFEIVDVSSGHVFPDPPTADSEVADISPDLPMRFDVTRIDDGSAMSITFEVFSTGPTLLDVRVEYG